jgi:hypothetical protein
MQTSIGPTPISGILSLVLSPLGLLVVVCFALFPEAQMVIAPRLAQFILASLLTSGLASGIAGLIRREHPSWLSVSGLLLTVCITGVIGLYSYSLDD